MHVYSLELGTETKQLNPKAKEFKPESIIGKPSRVAKATAKAPIKHFVDDNANEV